MTTSTNLATNRRRLIQGVAASVLTAAAGAARAQAYPNRQVRIVVPLSLIHI